MKTSPKGEKTLLTSILLSAPGPLVTAIAAITSGSATQIADFIRRTSELIATIISWLVFRKTSRDEALPEAERRRLERLATLAVSIAMVLAGLAMCTVGILRLVVPKASGNVTLGLIIAFLGLLTNAWLFLRYRSIARQEHNPVIAAQEKLYRAKCFVDFSVTAALLVVALWPTHTVSAYVDAVGSIVVAVYLVASGLSRRGSPTT